MNCKPGDLAIVVRGEPVKNLGRVVRCIKLELLFGEPCWRVEDDDARFADNCLRPIRDNDGEDETLIWAGLPNKQEQPA